MPPTGLRTPFPHVRPIIFLWQLENSNCLYSSEYQNWVSSQPFNIPAPLINLDMDVVFVIDFTSYLTSVALPSVSDSILLSHLFQSNIGSIRILSGSKTLINSCVNTYNNIGDSGLAKKFECFPILLWRWCARVGGYCHCSEFINVIFSADSIVFAQFCIHEEHRAC